ncbi:MAG: Xaa-Pro aminopeptidase, partial [uncultured Gemmatimonadetes bacterium]
AQAPAAGRRHGRRRAGGAGGGRTRDGLHELRAELALPLPDGGQRAGGRAGHRQEGRAGDRAPVRAGARPLARGVGRPPAGAGACAGAHRHPHAHRAADAGGAAPGAHRGDHPVHTQPAEPRRLAQRVPAAGPAVRAAPSRPVQEPHARAGPGQRPVPHPRGQDLGRVRPDPPRRVHHRPGPPRSHARHGAGDERIRDPRADRGHLPPLRRRAPRVRQHRGLRPQQHHAALPPGRPLHAGRRNAGDGHRRLVRRVHGRRHAYHSRQRPVQPGAAADLHHRPRRAEGRGARGAHRRAAGAGAPGRLPGGCQRAGAAGADRVGRCYVRGRARPPDAAGRAVLHARHRARHRARRARPRSVVPQLRGRLQGGERVHHRARRLHSRRRVGLPSRHAAQPAADRPHSPQGAAVPKHRRAHRGRLLLHRGRAGAGDGGRPARDRRDRSADGAGKLLEPRAPSAGGGVVPGRRSGHHHAL